LKKEELQKFGTYGINTLDDEIYRYPSPLQYQTSILDQIGLNIGPHRKNDFYCMLAIKAVLELLKDEDIKRYIYKMPAVNYLQVNE
jgi:hypothetical protein